MNQPTTNTYLETSDETKSLVETIDARTTPEGLRVIAEKFFEATYHMNNLQYETDARAFHAGIAKRGPQFAKPENPRMLQDEISDIIKAAAKAQPEVREDAPPRTRAGVPRMGR
jgi:hypothetical protein